MEKEYIVNKSNEITLNITAGQVDSYRVKDETQCTVRVYEGYGNHYRDYNNFSDCKFFYANKAPNTNTIINIGRVGICPYCGEEISSSSSISHGYCSI